MKIRMKVINEFGTFTSEIMEVEQKRYAELVEMSKTFWLTSEQTPSFNIWMDNGAAIFPPEIISKSILVIEII